MGSTPYAVALSEHPAAIEAVGEAVSQISEQLESQPSLAVVFASVSYHEQMSEVVAAISNFLKPGCLLATLCQTVIAGSREITDSPALAIWATTQGQATGVRLADSSQPQLPDEVSEAETLLLLADPFSFPVDNLLSELADSQPGLPVIGGMTSTGAHPDARQLWLNGDCHADGAIGALLSGFEPGGVSTRASQGCQPIGQPFTITHAEQNTIFELGGQPALERLKELITNASPQERQLMRHGIQLGIAVNEADTCDFLVRGIAGLDQEQGAIGMAGHIDIGDTVQFHVRDAQTAQAELRQQLGSLEPAAALLFACNGRGAHMFGQADREATLISELLGNIALAGMACSGEIGPVGNQNYLLGFTASMALFGLDPDI